MSINSNYINNLAIDLSNSSTNYYRLARVEQIKYRVFRLSSATEDQALLDAELQLRKVSSKVLVSVYAKELYTFSIDDDTSPPVPDLDELKFLKKAHEEVQTFKPQNSFKSSNGSPSSLMSLLSVTFLKALKKMIYCSLASKDEVLPFGNAGLLSSYDLLQIEPKLTEAGYLFVSISTRNLDLRSLEEVSRVDDEINLNNAIYLAPSGIRAYLSDGSVQNSITTKPSNSEQIINVLDSLHNIKIDPDTTTWIKLIPNLIHLNGMTAQISDYLKPVTNSKFLVWPLELCFHQPVKYLPSTNNESISFDPLSLIDDFVNLKATSMTKTPSTAPTTNNTPITLDHASVTGAANESTKPNIVISNLSSVTPSSTNENSENAAQQTNVSLTEEEADNSKTYTGSVNDDWNELDEELFGDGEVTDADFNFFDGQETNDSLDIGNSALNLNDSNDSNGNEIDEEMKLDENNDNDNDDDDIAADLASELELLTEQNNDVFDSDDVRIELLDIKEENEQDLNEEQNDPYDIPIHQMTLPSTPPYTDPGAPLPLQSPKTSQRKRSIFSPLNFNPIIKSNVDDKYANGGKFYVKTQENGKSYLVNNNSTPGLTGSDTATIPSFGIPDSFGKDDGDDESTSDSDLDSGSDSGDDDDDPDSSLEDGKSGKSKSSSAQPQTLEPISKKFKPNEGTPSDTPGIPLSSQRSISPSGATQASPQSPPSTNGVPNALPFLLRSIPIYGLPKIFFKSNPIIKAKNLDSFLEIFPTLISWDDSYLNELSPKPVDNVFNQDENVERGIAQIFPDIIRSQLFEYAGVCTKDKVVESPISSYKNLGGNVVSSNENGSPGQQQDNDENESASIFLIPQPKLSVKRLSQELTIDATALNLWNLMSFQPLGNPKDFRVLFITDQPFIESSTFFLDSLTEIYSKCQLGEVERLSVNENDKGVVGLKYHDLRNELICLGKKLNSSLVKSSNYKEILIVLADFDKNLSSTIKLVENFQVLREQILQLPNNKVLPISVSLKIVPSSYFTNRGVLSVLSINKLAKVSLSIYNNLIVDHDTKFTSLSLPLSLNFEFQLHKDLSQSSKILSQDYFIHLAYERSIDKEWVVASWTDNLGKIFQVKAYKSSNNLEDTMFKIWSFTMDIINPTLKQDKIFLVLTRLDGVIPDDELLQWKKLSSMNNKRKVSLIVISVNSHSKLLIKEENTTYPLNKLFQNEDSTTISKDLSQINNLPSTTSNTGLTPASTYFSLTTPNYNHQSPDLFNKTSAAIHENSPIDSNHFKTTEDNIIVDINGLIHGVLLSCPNSLSNSPSRLGIKTGFLVKPNKLSQNEFKTLEFNLLSRPSNGYNSNELMKLILIQFRQFISLNEVFGINDDSIEPWHVSSVRKVMDWLIHLRVEDE